jgi:DNA-binding NarL/FixJ family response regulator
VIPEEIFEDLRAAPHVDDELIDKLVELQIVGRTFNHRGELSKMQRSVFFCLSHGLDHKMTAEILGLSEGTVRSHSKRARFSLNAKDTTHLVALALRQGLID